MGCTFKPLQPMLFDFEHSRMIAGERGWSSVNTNHKFKKSDLLLCGIHMLPAISRFSVWYGINIAKHVYL